MDETKYFKNRKWVIKAGIAFLIILGLLTFFSNTIMNFSLPQVRTAYPMSGSISESIKGTGTVTAVKQTKIISSDTRQVDQVNVYLGQEVSMGDTIATLFPIKESEELKQAQSELDALLKSKDQDDLNDSLVEYDYTAYDEAIDAATQTLADANAVLVSAQGKDAAVTSAKSAVTTAQANIDSLESAIATLSLDKDLITANRVIYSENLTQAGLDYLPGSPEIAAAQALYDAENAALTAKNTEITSKNASLTTAQTTLASAQAKLATAESLPTVTAATKDVTDAQKSMDAANKALSDKKKQDKVTQTLDNMSKEDRDKAILAAQTTVDDLSELAANTEIVANQTGILSALNISQGSEITKDMVIATIDDKDAGFTVSISVPNNQAEQLQVGMSARNGEQYASPDDIAYITAIRVDSNNPTSHKTIIFSLVTGDDSDYNYYYYYSGQQLTLSLNNRSMQYACMIPNSAIHEDGEGKFVYVLQQKSSPLGERYKAIRVGVTILATDGTNSALDPAVLDNQSVITMSTKTLEDGKQVRLAYSQ